MGKHERPKRSAGQIDWASILIQMAAALITGAILLIFDRISK